MVFAIHWPRKQLQATVPRSIPEYGSEESGS